MKSIRYWELEMYMQTGTDGEIEIKYQDNDWEGDVVVPSELVED